MPPIEAMSVKQLVVASNNPSNELIIGIKFEYSEVFEEFMPEIGKYYYCYDYRFEDLREAVDYALSLSEDERSKIVEKAYEVAKMYDRTLVASALNVVMSW